jgi:hypothetical protein
VHPLAFIWLSFAVWGRTKVGLARGIGCAMAHPGCKVWQLRGGSQEEPGARSWELAIHNGCGMLPLKA